MAGILLYPKLVSFYCRWQVSYCIWTRFKSYLDVLILFYSILDDGDPTVSLTNFCRFYFILYSFHPIVFKLILNST